MNSVRLKVKRKHEALLNDVFKAACEFAEHYDCVGLQAFGSLLHQIVSDVADDSCSTIFIRKKIANKSMLEPDAKRLADHMQGTCDAHDENGELLSKIINTVIRLGCHDDGGQKLWAFVALVNKTIREADRAIRPEEYLDEYADQIADQIGMDHPGESMEFLEPVGPELRDDHGNVLRCRVVPVPDEGDAELRMKEQIDLIRHLGPGVVRCPEKIQ